MYACPPENPWLVSIRVPSARRAPQSLTALGAARRHAFCVSRRAVQLRGSLLPILNRSQRVLGAHFLKSQSSAGS